MCGRFVLLEQMNQLIKMFGLSDVAPFPGRYNIAPTQPILTVFNGEKGRESRLMRWGFVPGWVKDPRDFSLIINARMETLAEKPSFKTAIRNQRCVVPVSGYYEWLRQGDDKQPYYIQRENEHMLALAALKSTWEGPYGEEVDTVALITQPATGELRHIHHRTPVHMAAAQMELWLDVKNIDYKHALTLITPLEQVGMKAHSVSRAVSNAKNQGAELINHVPVSAAAPHPQKSTQGVTKSVKKTPVAQNGDQLDLF